MLSVTKSMCSDHYTNELGSNVIWIKVHVYYPVVEATWNNYVWRQKWDGCMMPRGAVPVYSTTQGTHRLGWSYAGDSSNVWSTVCVCGTQYERYGVGYGRSAADWQRKGRAVRQRWSLWLGLCSDCHTNEPGSLAVQSESMAFTLETQTQGQVAWLCYIVAYFFNL